MVIIFISLKRWFSKKTKVDLKSEIKDDVEYSVCFHQRDDGLRSRNFNIISLASLSKSCGKGTVAFTIFSNIFRSLSSKKGQKRTLAYQHFILQRISNQGQNLIKSLVPKQCPSSTNHNSFHNPENHPNIEQELLELHTRLFLKGS